MLTISVSALCHNYHVIRQKLPKAKILAMLKANAYGHGITTVASALADKVDGFGVACLSEAKILRERGVTQKIVLLRGVFTPAEFALAHQLALDLVIHDQTQVTLLLQKKILAQYHTDLTLWLKINTGMNRLGFSPEVFPQIFSSIYQYYKKIIFISHLACSEDKHNLSNLQQISCFNNITKNFAVEKSLLNSGGILNFAEYSQNQDWIRPGILLYGVSPLSDQTAQDLRLKPVMTWSSQLIAIQHCQKNDRIGYGHTYQCQKAMPIGIVGVGYADGYPRHAQNGTPVLVNQTPATLVGRVSMDMFAVDLRNVPNAKVGDPVTLWGEGLPIETVAGFTATSAYELLCGVKPRVC